MEDFDFTEQELSTSIDTLRKKKTELDDEKPYNVLRNRLFNEINTPPVYHEPVYVPKEYLHEIKRKKHKNKKKTFNYFNVFVYAIIFFIVNNYEFTVYLINKKLSYYTIIFIKLILFIIMNYIYKTFFAN